MQRQEKWDIALFLGGFLSWAVLTGADIAEISFRKGMHQYDIPIFAKGISLNLFLIFSYLYLRGLDHEKDESEEFYGLLWKTTALGLVCVLASLSLGVFIRLLSISDYFAGDILLVSLFHHIDFALMTIFLLTAFRKWKIMVLYQRTKVAGIVWRIFEYGLFLLLVQHLFRFSLDRIVYFGVTCVFVFLSFFPTANLRWIPYLNMRQKLMGMGMLVIILFVQFYFVSQMFRYSDQEELLVYVTNSVFFASLFIFTALYAVVSLLVMLFHLPTSSVFEKKISELAGFHQVSESILSGSNEQRVYQVLLDSAVQTVRADAAWLEVYNDKHDFTIKNLTHSEGKRLQQILENHTKQGHKPLRLHENQLPEAWPNNNFRCLIALPLVANRTVLGKLVLLKEIDKSFDNVIINSLNTFVTQASLAIYNFRLVTDAMATQRYQEELNIAHRVQEALLPNKLPSNEAFEMLVSTHSADKVGGDYYDYFKIAEDKYALIIADVSGHGTSAAFNMAQMKGVFHSLVRLDLSPDLFFEYTNDALSGCLERNSFVTASYFIIDTSQNKIYTARAGHCPTLYHSQEKNKGQFIQDKGLGLGILRNKKYAQHIKVTVLEYQYGDLLVLYTDGIIEARNLENNTQYGFDRLRDFIDHHHDMPLETISKRLIANVEKFSSNNIDDDYTLVLVRFNR